MSDQPATPRRVLSFTGTRAEFLRFLSASLAPGGPPHGMCWSELAATDRDVYEWQLTGSIARHPAGKGLRADG